MLRKDGTTRPGRAPPPRADRVLEKEGRRRRTPLEVALPARREPAEAEERSRGRTCPARMSGHGAAKGAKAWTTFAFHSLLGEALLVQKKYAAAEPLLVQGYEGLEQQAMKIPPQLRQTVLIQALQRLVLLCEATGQKDQAQAWRKKLQAVQQAKPVNK